MMGTPATPALPALTAVHGAVAGGDGLVVSARVGSYQECLAADEALGHGRPAAGEDAGERGPRDAHLLGGSFLVQAVEISKPNGLQFGLVHKDRLDIARRAADGDESPAAEADADAAGMQRSGHARTTDEMSICSFSDRVNPTSAATARR